MHNEDPIGIDVPSNRFDERSLETELKESASPKKRFDWEWLNKPITLWALTTLAVGILSFVYSQYSTCNRQLDADSLRFEKLLSELALRAGTLYGAVAQQPTEATAYTVSLALDPNETFLYSEFKGKSVAEIGAEASLLFRRWHPSEYGMWIDLRRHDLPGILNSLVRPQGVGKPQSVYSIFDTFTRAIGAQTDKLKVAGVRGARVLVFLGLLDVWGVAQRSVSPTAPPELVAAIVNWGRALGTQTVELTQREEEIELGSSLACARRALWPF